MHLVVKIIHMSTRADRYNSAVGQQIKAELGAHGKNIKATAEALGMARSTLDNYTKGDRLIPVSVVIAVADYLEISPRLLMERAEERFDTLEKQRKARLSVVPTGQTVDLHSVDLSEEELAATRDKSAIPPERGES